AAPLDLDVRGGDGPDAPAEGVTAPALEGPARLVDLPRGHPEVAGEVGAATPACSPDLRQLPQLRGEDRDDRDGVDTDVDGVTQQPQRLPRPAGHGGVGDLEPGRLHATAVVALHDVGVDRAGGVVDELPAGGGELAHVLADGLDERLQRLRCRLAPGPPELVADDVGVVPC